MEREDAMKHFRAAAGLIAVVTLGLLAGCGANESNETKFPYSIEMKLPRSMKGYELYGYQKSGEVFFALMTGTNRIKTFQEIDDNASFLHKDGWVHLKAKGIDGGKAIINRVNSEFLFIESVRNSAGVYQSTIPDSVANAAPEVIDALREYWDQRKEDTM